MGNSDETVELEEAEKEVDFKKFTMEFL